MDAKLSPVSLTGMVTCSHRSQRRGAGEEIVTEGASFNGVNRRGFNIYQEMFNIWTLWTPTAHLCVLSKTCGIVAVMTTDDH